MKRYIVISVPDSEKAFWFVYDKKNRRSIECESRTVAREITKLANENKAKNL